MTLVRSWKAAGWVLVLALAAGVAPARADQAAASDPRAIRIADEVMKKLGGKQKWDALPGLRWTFGASVNDTMRSSRRHLWNKHTGWHRVEGKTGSGDSYCIIHKVGGSEGRAWVNGNAIEGDSLKKLIARGERLWVNDTYWMLMPYKLRDPGVHLGYDGEKKLDGKTYDVVALSFDHVGQTPGDRYWVYVNRGTRMVERWEMVLQDDQPPPVAYTWSDWVEKGGLWFPTAHRKDRTNIATTDVVAVTAFAPTDFTAP